MKNELSVGGIVWQSLSSEEMSWVVMDDTNRPVQLICRSISFLSDKYQPKPKSSPVDICIHNIL